MFGDFVPAALMIQMSRATAALPPLLPTRNPGMVRPEVARSSRTSLFFDLHSAFSVHLKEGNRLLELFAMLVPIGREGTFRPGMGISPGRKGE